MLGLEIWPKPKWKILRRDLHNRTYEKVYFMTENSKMCPCRCCFSVQSIKLVKLLWDMDLFVLSHKGPPTTAEWHGILKNDPSLRERRASLRLTPESLGIPQHWGGRLSHPQPCFPRSPYQHATAVWLEHKGNVAARHSCWWNTALNQISCSKGWWPA